MHPHRLFIRITPESPANQGFHRWDPGKLHRTVWRFFDFDPDASRDFLFRVDDITDQKALYVQCSRLPIAVEGWRLEIAPYAPSPRLGDVYQFSIRVNPTLKREGKSHDRIMDRKRREPNWRRDGILQQILQEEGAAWIASRAHCNGFHVQPKAVRATNYQSHRFHKTRNRNHIRMSTLELRGQLQVDDPEAFRKVLLHGLGRGKSYGCGLFLLRAPFGANQKSKKR